MDAKSHRIEEVVDLIHEAGIDESLWTPAIQAIAQEFGARTASLYLQDARNGSFSRSMADRAVIYGYESRFVESYTQHYGELNPFHRRSEFKVSDRIITERDLPADLTQDEKEYMEDWIRPQGVQHVMGQMLNERAAATLSLVVWRGMDAGAFRPEEETAFRRFARATERSVHAAERLYEAEGAFAALSVAFDARGVGVVTLRADGRVRFSNSVADALLSAGDGLLQRNGRLEALHAQDRSSLERLIEAVLREPSALQAERQELHLRRRDSQPDLRVRALALPPRYSRFRHDAEARAILLIEVPEPAALTAERLRHVWSLTPAEARLATLLVEPVSLQEAAQRLGIGHETARTQLKALFGKTGTRRQSELIVRLLVNTG